MIHQLETFMDLQLNSLDDMKQFAKYLAGQFSCQDILTMKRISGLWYRVRTELCASHEKTLSGRS